MTDETEDPSADSLRAVFRAGWKRQEKAIPGRRSATLSVHMLLEKIAAIDVEEARNAASPASANSRRRLTPGLSKRSVGLWIGGMTAVLGSVVFLTRHVNTTHRDAVHVYATHAYQQAIVNLGDGTRVTLAPQTTLRTNSFGAQSRTIELESGEAYFEVAHAPGIPFVVRSGTVTIQVLGTAFLVRHGAIDRSVRVAVSDGKVRVKTAIHADTGITLTTGQIGDITDSTVRASTTDDLAPGVEWDSERLIFRHASVATVLQTVGRWYGYQFRYADQRLSERIVTMGISTRSSAEALAAIEQVLAVNLTVVGDTITLVPQPPRSKHNIPRIQTYDVWTPAKEVGR